MAKTKTPLTPEQAEVKAMKKEKNSQGFIKFVAVLLALVLTVGVVFVGKTTADKALEAAGNNVVVNGDETNTPSDDTNTPSGDVSTDTPADDTTDAPADDTTDAPAADDAPAGDDAPAADSKAPATKAEMAKLLNDVTAGASKGSYDWARSAKFTKDINVGGLTKILDGIIKGVDENASLNSVVGGFLGIKEQALKASVKNGQLPKEGMGDAKYLLKAMNLSEGDIESFTVSGNKYTVKIKPCTDPTPSSSWGKASNDYITYAAVNKGISDSVGDAVKVLEDESDANYKDIVVIATIDNGKLTALEYSYNFDATLKIKAGITATGTGAARMEAKYTNIKY